MIHPEYWAQWAKDCKHWRGHVLYGPDSHWCFDWDGLPVSACTPEYDCCTCSRRTWLGKLVNKVYMWFFYRREEWVRFQHPK